MTESPSQLRRTEAAIDWEPSPSPFGCEGLISMEIGSPFQLFPPTSFGVVDADQSDSASVFSPSMFSPSNSKFAMTLRSLKKTEAGSPDLYQNAMYSASELQLCEMQSLKNCGQLSSSSSSSSFQRSLYSAPSSSMRPTVDTRRLVRQDVDQRIPVVTNRSERMSFFSPDSSLKPNNSATEGGASLTSRQNYGIADTEYPNRDIPGANTAKRDFSRVPRKNNRVVGADPRVSNSVTNLNIESQFLSSTSYEEDVDKLRTSNRTSGLANRSAFASPLLVNLRDEGEQAYADSVMVTPTQCKCKKTKCLKLYCDCFALLRYCGPNCGCTDCHNDPAHSEIRRVAVAATMQRTATAFTSKVTPNSAHVAGCNCSKSNCLKKYCECFLNGATCGASCKCQQCKNFPGSEALKNAKKPESTSQTSSSAKLNKERGNTIKSDRKANLRGHTRGVASDDSMNSSTTSQPSFSSLNISQLRSRSDSTVSALRSSGNDKTSAFTNWDVCVEKPFEIAWASSEAIRKADDYSGSGIESSAGVEFIQKDEVSRYATRSSRSKDENMLSLNREVLPFQANSFQSITPSGPGQLFDHNLCELSERTQGAWNGFINSRQDDTQTNSSIARNPPTYQSSTTLTPSAPLLLNKSKQNQSQFKSDQALKRRKTNETKIVYPYFGPSLPYAPKICALRCLEYLDGSDFYSVSVLNHLWSKTATDSALWE